MKASHLYIKVAAGDNVAIVVSPGGLAEGAQTPDGFVIREAIPQAHKVALKDFTANEPILRYNQVIGYANAPIERGSWVKETMLRLPAPPGFEDLPLATELPAPASPLEGYTWEGYLNIDGTAGTKNLLGVSTSVQCVAGVVDHAVARIKAELLPKFPNVDGVIALNHAYGCGVAINAPDAIVPIRTLQNLARNPNLGGAPMIVGLGCEKLLPETLVAPAGTVSCFNDSGIVRLQDEKNRGFNAMISSILEMAEKRLAELNKRKRVVLPASQLIVGLQCGGSDAFSGVTANPALGYAADLLVRAGATVMFSEVTEVRDAIHLLTPRAADVDVARALIREMDWYDRYLAAGSADRSANPTPGNKKGGLSNVVEKALGSVAKSGTSQIVQVLSPGQRATKKGLIFAATPASDFVCGTLQLAAGMNLEVFTTGRGTPYNLEMAPVIKVSTRTALAEQWHDLIDLDAGRIATGSATIEDVGWELFRMILDVASGRKKTWADHWGIVNDTPLFNPGPLT